MYKHVEHRATLASIADEARDCFGIPLCAPNVYTFKSLLTRYYAGTCKRLLEKIIAGHLLHVDETEVHLKSKAKGYVWVFTNLEEVVFLYRPSREGDFLPELLPGFRGVLVSDFYAPYDGIDCPQQKCLVHLMRDFNHDLQANPWDEELKSLAACFGELLREIVTAVDRFGLKKRHLGKHRRGVECFLAAVAATEYRSELALAYRQRLLKNHGKLFTFLEYDGVPWNNNNAEHAIKRFAYYREIADGQFTERGLTDYLALLSICVTCKYKGVSFLKFLLSRETDIDVFCQRRHRATPAPALDMFPEGTESSRRKRRPNWEQGKQTSPE
jgi:hypothetical protein